MNQDFFAEYQTYIYLIIGLAVILFSLLGKTAKSKLKDTGIPVEGIVFTQSNGTASKERYGFSKEITIRFVTKTGEWITGVMKQDFIVFYPGQYKGGDTVKLYYDKDNPSDFYVETKQLEPVGRLITGFVGVALLLTGLYRLFT